MVVCLIAGSFSDSGPVTFTFLGQLAAGDLLCEALVARHGRRPNALKSIGQLRAFQSSANGHASTPDLHVGFALGKDGQVVLPKGSAFDRDQWYLGTGPMITLAFL